MDKGHSEFNATGSSFLLESAKLRDAAAIAKISRDQIETGLGWSWTPERVWRAIIKPNSIVLKAMSARRLIGFGIMSVSSAKANLNLLAVEPEFRRRGVGAELLVSLEQKAFDLNTENFYVQVREHNQLALRFYHQFGYEMIDRNERYYKHREAAVILYKYCPTQISPKKSS